MIRSESIKNLAIALAKFTGEVENPKNVATNPFFKSKYAPLNEVLNVVKPLLAKYGLSVIQTAFGNTIETGITTMLLHESGEFIESEPLIFKNEKATAQSAGSSITYARRYAISAILNISSEQDDDGAVASNTTTQNKPQQQINGLITEAQAKRLFAIAKGNLHILKGIAEKHGFKTSKDITVKSYEGIVKELEEAMKGAE